MCLLVVQHQVYISEFVCNILCRHCSLVFSCTSCISQYYTSLKMDWWLGCKILNLLASIELLEEWHKMRTTAKMSTIWLSLFHSSIMLNISVSVYYLSLSLSHFPIWYLKRFFCTRYLSTTQQTNKKEIEFIVQISILWLFYSISWQRQKKNEAANTEQKRKCRILR